MAFHVFVFLLVFFLMLSLAWFGRLTLLHHGLAHSKAGAVLYWLLGTSVREKSL